MSTPDIAKSWNVSKSVLSKKQTERSAVFRSPLNPNVRKCGALPLPEVERSTCFYECIYSTANANVPALLVNARIKEKLLRLREIKNASLGNQLCCLCCVVYAGKAVHKVERNVKKRKGAADTRSGD